MRCSTGCPTPSSRLSTRLLREREVDGRIVASYGQTPQHQSDGWADLRAVNEVARDAVLDRLDAEARLNRQPW